MRKKSTHVGGHLTPYARGQFRRIAPRLAGGMTQLDAGMADGVDPARVRYLLRAARRELTDRSYRSEILTTVQVCHLWIAYDELPGGLA